MVAGNYSGCPSAAAEFVAAVYEPPGLGRLSAAIEVPLKRSVLQCGLDVCAPVGCSKASCVIGSKLKRHDPPHEAGEKRHCKINVSMCRAVGHPLANQ